MNDDPPPSIGRSAHRAGPRRTICRILVIEDHPGIRAVLAEALAQRGYDFLLLSSRDRPSEGMRRERSDVAIIDVPLAAADAFALAALARDCDMPVILTVADTTLLAKVEASGHLYLAKPFKLAPLLRLVDTAVRAHRLDCVRRRAVKRA